MQLQPPGPRGRRRLALDGRQRAGPHRHGGDNMATRAKNDNPSGPRLTDEVGKVVALHLTGALLDGESKMGAYSVPEAEAVYGLATDGLEPTYVPSTPIFWQVIQEQLAAAVVADNADDPTAGWVIGVLRKFKAYQIDSEALDDDTFAKLDARLADLLTPQGGDAT